MIQRRHVDDLSGVPIERGWPKQLVIPAIAVEPTKHLLSDDEVYHRPTGEILQPGRDSPEAIEEFKLAVGSHVFAAQFQQNLTLPDRNMIKAEWLGRYEGAFCSGRSDLRPRGKSRYE